MVEIILTLSVHIRTTFDNSKTTRSIHFRQGSFNLFICFFTIASNAISGVKRPTLIPEKENKNLLNEQTYNGLPRLLKTRDQFDLNAHPPAKKTT